VSTLRERLGEAPVAGTFLKLAGPEVVELAAAALDFAVVDLEHSALTEGDALRLVAHARLLGFPALVRVPAVDRGQVNRLLEAGAAGIQLSTVRTAAQVRALRAACLYPPRGTRSISLAHAGARFGAAPLAEYLAGEGDGPLVVAQIETAETDDPLADIMAAGPDVAFVGLTDLSVDLGLDRERVERRVAEIADAAEAAGVVLGGFGLADPRTRYRVDSSDIALLRSALAGVR
jgi:4-hydroxy-2-oxoheptanedioate aldolase